MVELKQIVKEDLLRVLSEAVEAYELAAMRDRMGYIASGYTAETLVETFPKYFAQHSSGKVKFIGKSANEVLENYLEGLGYKPGSRKWYQLAQWVVDLAQEEEEVDIESYIKKTRAKRCGGDRPHNEGPIRRRPSCRGSKASIRKTS